MNVDDVLFNMADHAVLRAVDEQKVVLYWKRLMRLINDVEHQGWKKVNGMTQNDKIINHMLKNGSITQREALIDYSIQSLTKRISELREMGFPIRKEVRRHPVTGQTYARYFLGKIEAKAA